jgi:hypothetical protein
MKIRIGGDHPSLLMKIDGLEAYGQPKGLFAQPLRCVIDSDIGDLKVVIGKLRGYAALDAADSAARFSFGNAFGQESWSMAKATAMPWPFCIA